MTNLVIGASLKPIRYSHMAMERLREHGHHVSAIGLREGKVAGVNIDLGKPEYDDVDTVLLYINPSRQPEYYDYIIGLKPRRVLFAPGTENQVFQDKLSEEGIEPIEACSLVMLSTGQY